MSKKELAITLSGLKTFQKPSMRLEQYPTDSEIAADLLWTAFLNNDLQGRKAIDLGSGTGILGLGAALLGAREIVLAEIDPEAIKISEQNERYLRDTAGITTKSSYYSGDISLFQESGDVVITNPPFGTKIKNADTLFLKVAFNIAPKVYSLHKTSTKEYIIHFAEKNVFKAKRIKDYAFPIKNTMSHHKKKIERIDVSLFQFEKINPHSRI